MASCKKVPKFDFQSQFSMSKIIPIFLVFLLKNTNLGAHFFVIDIEFLNHFIAQFLTDRHYSNYLKLVISFDYS